MDKAAILKKYDDYLPDILEKVRKYYELAPPDHDPMDAFFDKKKLKELKQEGTVHSKALTLDNVSAMTEDAMTYADILETIAKKVGVEPEELRDLLGERELQSWPSEMPEFVYRGTVKDDTVRGVDDRRTPGKKIVFISTEPSIAASYARRDKFDIIGDTMPSDYGDFIYRIRTAGLDPAKFKKDDTATSTENLFGPQYYYEDELPDDVLDVVDQGGNTRRGVPRIEKIPYFSDQRLKNIIEAVRK